MTHVLIALTLLGWGIAGIFDKKAVGASTARSVFITFHVFGVLMALALFITLPYIYGAWHIAPAVMFWEAMNAFAALGALLAYFYAMGKTQASWVLGITAGYPIFGQLLATPLTGEPFSAGLLMAAVLVSVGVALIGSSSTEEQKALPGKEKFLLFGAVAITTILWGVLGIFEKRSLEFGRPFECYLMLSIWKSCLILPAFYIFRRQGHAITLNSLRTWRFSWLSAACVALGNIAFILALTTSSAGYMIIITATYPLIMYGFAMLFLKERLNIPRAAGIALIVAGAVVAELAKNI